MPFGAPCIVGTTTTRIAGGQPGQSGAPRTEPIPTAIDGTAITPTTGSADWNTVFDLASNTYISMVLHAAEDDYINLNKPDAVARLVWLKGTLDISSNKAPRDPSFAASRSRTYTLLRQIQLGVGYYGQYGNYVPLLSADYFEKLLAALNDYGTAIEISYNSYVAQAASGAAKMQALNSARQATDANIAKLRGHLQDLVTAQGQLQQDIKDALVEVNELWAQLFQANANFRAAVEAQSQGCSFVQLMTLAAAIATLVATGGTAIAAIGPAATALEGGDLMGSDGKPITSDFAAFTAKVGAVYTAGKDTASFVSAFNVVKNQISPAPAQNAGTPTLPSDDAKILTQASDFDRELQPYITLPEAQTYKELMHTFIASAQARNNKILEFNANIAEYDNTVTAIQSLQQQDSDIDTKVAAANDPTIIEAQLFMASANRDSKARIVGALFDLYRAVKYYSLQDSSLRITDFSIATLKSTASSLLDQYSSAREQLGIPPQHFSDKQVRISKYLSGPSMRRFASSGIITFAIADDEEVFANYSHVLCSRIWVSFAGPAVPPTGFQAAFKNHGRSVLFDDTDKAHTFSHVTIPVSYELGDDGSITVDGTFAPAGGDYIGVSPYGPWTLRMLNMSAAVLQNISDIVVHFDGYARSRPA
jgi:hypothetical protein